MKNQLQSPSFWGQFRVFVAMPFSDSHRSFYASSIQPAIHQCGERLQSQAITIKTDEFFGSGSILRDIVEGIFWADAVIVILADNNPNVYYELGVTHALGRKVLVVCEKSYSLPFDINSYSALSCDMKTGCALENQNRIADELYALSKSLPTRSSPVMDYAPIRYWELVVPHEQALKRELITEKEVWVIGPNVDIDIMLYANAIRSNIFDRGVQYKYILPDNRAARASWNQLIHRLELHDKIGRGIFISFVDEYQVEFELVIYDPYSESEEVYLTPPVEAKEPFYFVVQGTRAIAARNRFAVLWSQT